MNFLGAPDNLRTYVCQHVFEDSRPISLVSRENDGDFLCLCGCTFEAGDRIHVVAFGHLKPRLEALGERSFPEPGMELELIDGVWREGPLSE